MSVIKEFFSETYEERRRCHGLVKTMAQSLDPPLDKEEQKLLFILEKLCYQINNPVYKIEEQVRNENKRTTQEV